MKPDLPDETPPHPDADAFATSSAPAAGREHDSAAASLHSNIELVMRIPVSVKFVLGSVTMPVSRLMKLGRGAVIPLERRVGDPVDVVVNGHLLARGELVVLDEDGTRFGISLTQILSRAPQ